MRHLSLALAVGVMLLAMQGGARAQVIPSALPAIGGLLDIRDVKNIVAGKGKFVLTGSHVYQTIDQFYDSRGAKRDLSLNQSIDRHAVPLFGTYGLSDRWNIGLGLTVFNDLDREISVLNFTPGATLLNQPLPLNQVTRVEPSGSGAGDLNFVLQYRPRWFGTATTSLLSLDVVAPTAESDPANDLDLPIGQGHWSYRLSGSALHEVYPMAYFAKVGYQVNSSDTRRDALGNRIDFDNGDGFDYTVGARYAISERVGLQALLVGFQRGEAFRSDQAAAAAPTRSLEFRPGYSVNRGDWTLTQQLSIPVAGRNVLAAEGVLTTLEYRF